jgi:hypothetical protein
MAATDYWSFICEQYYSCADYNFHKWLRGKDDYKLLLAKDALKKQLQTSWNINLHHLYCLTTWKDKGDYQWEIHYIVKFWAKGHSH